MMYTRKWLKDIISKLRKDADEGTASNHHEDGLFWLRRRDMDALRSVADLYQSVLDKGGFILSKADREKEENVQSDI